MAETWDGELNDINGFHVRPEHVWRALDEARTGPVTEGSVGGGTGMICHELKCGIGTASRVVRVGERDYCVGALVQANYGARRSLRIAGVPIGIRLRMEDQAANPFVDHGSIIIVIGTDAPLLPHQLQRLARRAGMGLARMGSSAGNGSGDIFIASSTANRDALTGQPLAQASFLNNDALDPFFEATVQATEEAIVNSMVAARDMEGTEGRSASALPRDQLIALLRHHRRHTSTR